MGQPAARKTDNVAHRKAAGLVLMGSANVLIGGLPASRQGDLVQHGKGTEPITEGEATVLINGRPAARLGDHVACTGVIATGCGTVLIGEIAEGVCLAEAAQSNTALVKPE